MRNIERMEPFLQQIEEIWKTKCPDWRFGQLMFNFISAMGDPFYWEEDTFIAMLKKYFEIQEKEK